MKKMLRFCISIPVIVAVICAALPFTSAEAQNKDDLRLAGGFPNGYSEVKRGEFKKGANESVLGWPMQYQVLKRDAEIKGEWWTQGELRAPPGMEPEKPKFLAPGTEMILLKAEIKVSQPDEKTLATWFENWGDPIPKEITGQTHAPGYDYDKLQGVYVTPDSPSYEPSLLARYGDNLIAINIYMEYSDKTRFPEGVTGRDCFRASTPYYRTEREDLFALWDAVRKGLGEDRIDLKGTLFVRQELQEPGKIGDLFRLRNPVTSLREFLKEGKASHYLVFQVENLPSKLKSPVKVTFEVDPPSKLSGSFRNIPVAHVVRQNVPSEEASASFVYIPSEVSSDAGVVYDRDAGVIYGRARYPEYFQLIKDEYVPSAKTKTSTVRIRKVCGGTGLSIVDDFYKDNLVSDMKYDFQELDSQFRRAVEEYGKNSITVTSYNFEGLGFFLANHGGEMMGMKIEYYSGKESELRDYVYSEGKSKKISPGGLLKKALELNSGNLTNALLTCHNLTRAAGRGRENFGAQFTGEEAEINKGFLESSSSEQKEFMKKFTRYDELPMEERPKAASDFAAKVDEIRKKKGEKEEPELFNCLERMRGDDNAAGWYHLFGTATASFASQTETGKANQVLFLRWITPSFLQRKGLNLVIWGEERFVSADIFSDPNEYCVDNCGLLLGDTLLDYVKTGRAWAAKRNRYNRYIKDMKDYLTQQKIDTSRWGDSPPPWAVCLDCPVSMTVTDRKTGRSFVFDQEKGIVAGDLPSWVMCLPDGGGKYFRLLAYFPPVDLEVRCRALEKGSFSLTSFDFKSRNLARYDNVAVEAGDDLSVNVPFGNVKQDMKNRRGQTFKPDVRTVSQNELNDLRRETDQELASEMKPAAGPNGAGPVTSGSGKGRASKLPAFAWFAAGGAVLLAVAAVMILRRRNTGTGEGDGTSTPEDSSSGALEESSIGSAGETAGESGTETSEDAGSGRDDFNF